MVGCVHLQKMGNKCMLGMLSVNVNYQNSGIGRIIIDKSEEYARVEFKCSEMIMKVIDVRKELLEYYYRRGYELTGEREYFNPDKKHFGKPKVGDLYFVYLSKSI